MSINIDSNLIANSVNKKLSEQTKQLDNSLKILNNNIKPKLQNKITQFNNMPSTVLKDVTNFKMDIDSEIDIIKDVPMPVIDSSVDVIKNCFDGMNLDLDKLLGIKLDINLNMPKLDIIDSLSDLIFDNLKGKFDLKLSGYFDPVIDQLLGLLEPMQELIPKDLIDSLFGMSDCISSIVTPIITPLDIENKLANVGLDSFGKIDYSHFGL
jgi:hypothetical protein